LLCYAMQAFGVARVASCCKATKLQTSVREGAAEVNLRERKLKNEAQVVGFSTPLQAVLNSSGSSTWLGP
jgi:hypothetical protein